jgi:non-ribosomal peptide synthetase component E (peptide arylation enzyme)
VIRGQDWVKARIEEGLYRLFMSNDKVSMDNVGIAQVEGVLRSVLKRAGNMGIIAAATTESELETSDDKEFLYKVTVPRREDILPGDRAARILPDVEFIYYLAGAIHEAEVRGKITV